MGSRISGDAADHEIDSGAETKVALIKRFIKNCRQVSQVFSTISTILNYSQLFQLSKLFSTILIYS